MQNPKTKTVRRRVRTLYHSAKITPYQFKRVLWAFVLDQSAAEAAKHIKLSANSIGAIYLKLRQFFYDTALFRDLYKGGDPRQGLDVPDHEDVEQLILLFHMERVSAKRGQLDAPLHGPDHHFAESNWRFDYYMLAAERGAESLHPVMYANLLEFIQRFGPVGSPRPITPAQRAEGRALALEQLDRQILWLERNSVKFKREEDKNDLRELRRK